MGKNIWKIKKMIKSKFELFMSLYVLINNIYDQTKNKDLVEYLSDANPFVWGEETSWDPAVYDNFSELYDKSGNLNDYGYEFVKLYLSQLDDYYKSTKTVVNNISKENYISEIKKILSNPFDYYRNQFAPKDTSKN